MPELETTESVAVLGDPPLDYADPEGDWVRLAGKSVMIIIRSARRSFATVSFEGHGDTGRLLPGEVVWFTISYRSPKHPVTRAYGPFTGTGTVHVRYHPSAAGLKIGAVVNTEIQEASS